MMHFFVCSASVVAARGGRGGGGDWGGGVSREERTDRISQKIVNDIYLYY